MIYSVIGDGMDRMIRDGLSPPANRNNFIMIDSLSPYMSSYGEHPCPFVKENLKAFAILNWYLLIDNIIKWKFANIIFHRRQLPVISLLRKRMEHAKKSKKRPPFPVEAVVALRIQCVHFLL